MNTKEKWFNTPVQEIVHLDILVIRIKDHEDRRYILLQVLHHGQRHSFHQVVPSIWDHIPEIGWVLIIESWRQVLLTGLTLRPFCSVGSPQPW